MSLQNITLPQALVFVGSLAVLVAAHRFAPESVQLISGVMVAACNFMLGRAPKVPE